MVLSVLLILTHNIATIYSKAFEGKAFEVTKYSLDSLKQFHSWPCHVSGSGQEEFRVHTIWLQIFIVEKFCNFHNYTIITKTLFTKILSQLILDIIGAR